MPLEGHYARQTTPLYKLSSRERWAGFGVLVVTLIAIGVVVAFTVGDSRPGPAKGCIRAHVAGIVGGETISGCGVEAITECRHAEQFTGVRAETVLAECRKQEIDF